MKKKLSLVNRRAKYQNKIIVPCILKKTCHEMYQQQTKYSKIKYNSIKHMNTPHTQRLITVTVSSSI